ncbi:ABC transporter permease [Aureivirga marina]|uniref:ABC transporter permease n=1 Tax=Aureivirga marina TaxID=1182451 RepID=UPI0018C95050|nr:ABC transporter permease [Aureivirga marina]
MLLKLQKKTLIKSQIIGYAFTLLIGMSILLTVFQLYIDVNPLLTEQTDIFKKQSAIISKKISLFKTLNKEKIYFKEKEIEELKKLDFIENVSVFQNTNFKVQAFTSGSSNFPMFQTDLFFESIPDIYLDINPEEWKWNASENFIPIIIPENYLNLYNFGFAESQGLPVLSKNTISNLTFNLQITGNYTSQNFKSRIVGFSSKINSILVPNDFLIWANKKFSDSNNSNKINRVLLEFNKPADEQILNFFKSKDYEINKEKLEFSKLFFFFKSAIIFVFIISLIIVILSIAFIFLSLNLIIQRNKEMLLNLANIGYTYQQIAKFYQIMISVVTVFVLFFAGILSTTFRNMYLVKISELLNFKRQENFIFIGMFLVLILLLGIYNTIIIRKIKKVV